jgi:hypothetical protein
VPHISLVFREMWDTTALTRNIRLPINTSGFNLWWQSGATRIASNLEAKARLEIKRSRT